MIECVQIPSAHTNTHIHIHNTFDHTHTKHTHTYTHALTSAGDRRRGSFVGFLGFDGRL
jgi:hypothetical protein